MLLIIGVVAVAFIVLGVLLEAARWLVIIGAIAFLVMIVLAFVKGRQATRR
ncbi:MULTISPECIES: hypothetical protein [Micromonospora]|nr:hypothetical protein [Micromonospora yangpuensis]